MILIHFGSLTLQNKNVTQGEFPLWLKFIVVYATWQQLFLDTVLIRTSVLGLYPLRLVR